jgi:hypothetical protein
MLIRHLWLFALATLSDMTQTGLVLFVSCCPRWPRQGGLAELRGRIAVTFVKKTSPIETWLNKEKKLYNLDDSISTVDWISKKSTEKSLIKLFFKRGFFTKFES